MRTLGYCIAGMVLLMVDYGVAGNGGRLIGTVLQSPPPEQVVVRDRKGDRLPAATTMQRQPPGPVTPGALQPAPASKSQPTNHAPLLKGCEPAHSPLTGATLTGLDARCVA
jgi:hypothetical protein